MDPFPGVLSLPGTQHPYVYGLNSPAMYVDPSGESVLLTLGVIAGAGVLAGAIDLLFNQFPAIIDHYGGREGVLQAMRCGELESVLSMIDVGALAGAITNAVVAGVLATAITWAIPLFIGLLPISGLGAIATSIALHWLYGGLFGFVGGLSGAIVEAVINGESLDYDSKNALDDFRWGAFFLAFGAFIGELAKWSVIVTTQANL